jgi:uncharacterized protein
MSQLKHRARTLLLLLLPATIAAQGPELVLLTGSKGGTYHAFGLAISRIVEQSGRRERITVQRSNGSVDNLKQLSRGEADFGIVQSDIAYAAARGLPPFSKDSSIRNVSALMGLFYEEVLVIAHKRHRLQSVSDIEGLRVVVGRSGSGTYANAIDVLNAIRPRLTQIDSVALDPRASLAGLARGEFDVVFLTATLDTNLRATILADSIELVPLDEDLIARLRKSGPYYESATVLLGSDTVSTVRIRAYLVAHNKVPPNRVTSVVQSIYESWSALRDSFPVGRQEVQESPAEVHAVDLNPWAERYYCSVKIRTCSKSLQWMVVFASAIALLALIIWFSAPTRGWLLRHAPKLSRALFGPHGVTDRFRYLVIPILVSAFMLAGSLFIQTEELRYAKENNIHSDFEDLALNRKLIWMLVFTATGFEDERFPNSATGKVTSALMGWVGIGSILLLIGLLTSDKVARRMKMRLQSHPDHLKDHVIVCGWNRRAKAIINDLTTTELGARRQQVAVLCRRKSQFIDQQQLDGDVVLHIDGDPTDLAKLEQAGVDRAHTVLILADDAAPDSDARALLTLVTIEKRANRRRRDGQRVRALRTVVEILDPQNRELFRDDHAGAVVCSADFDVRLLSNSILNPVVSSFLSEVLTTGKGDEIIEVPVTGRENKAIVGQTFDELLQICRADGLLLLAINQGGAPGALSLASRNAELSETGTLLIEQQLLTNPTSKEGRAYRVASGDSLLFLADSERSLEHIFGDPRHWQVKFTG